MAYPQQTIYLASASPRRRELLKQIGVHFEVLLLRSQNLLVGLDETPQPGEDPREYVMRLAQSKAAMGDETFRARRLPVHPVLAADTAVILDQEIIGKPVNRADAEETLARLAGRRHEVLTAVAVAVEDRVEVALSASIVEFAPLDPQTIKRYVATGESHDKAGSYAIQGRAAAFISRIEGSYSGVMGLPLFETVELLKKLGIQIP